MLIRTLSAALAASITLTSPNTHAYEELALGISIAAAHEGLSLEDGLVYQGEVIDGEPHGEGRMIWPSGAFYEGDWRNGIRHGLGEYTDSEGGYYVGAYENGERTGLGTFTWPNGRAYSGDWRAGLPHGEGFETVPGSPHTVYRGPFRAGLRHGEGIETPPRGLARRCRWEWGAVVPDTCRGLARESRNP